MTREEVSDWLHNAEANFDYSKHELLVNLTCIYENDKGDFEVTFAVPAQWLIDYIKREWSEEWDFEKLHFWLCNEYTSDDSQQILDIAIEENKIAFWIMN